MSADIHTTLDCIVVGSGHAGSCAALSARDSGCKRVLIVEKSPPEWVGGNGYFTAGAHRTVHDGLHDLLPVVTNVSADMADKIDLGPYTAEDFTRDIMRLGNGQSDPGVVKALVDGSRDAVQWLSERVRMPFVFSFNRQAYLVNGRQVFWGGLALAVEDGGKGMIAADRAALENAGVETWFDTAAVEILVDGGSVVGLKVSKTGETVILRAPSVVLACGGFEANKALRAQYLGAIGNVRGTPFNTGDGLTLAQRVGARLTGDFAGCHSTCWDANAPDDRGDRVLSNQFTKSGYPLGLMLNARGVRFVDEGEDFRNYTYAKFGREIISQPGGYAFQVWDSTVVPWLRKEEYADDVVEKVWGETVEELAAKLVPKGLEDAEAFVRTIRQYNDAARAYRAEHSDVQWDPAVKDGVSTQSGALKLALPKSNWALPLERPPFLAVKVTCGITFTFGGLAIEPETATVISDESGKPIPGLFCTGELVGGLFYNNYPGGSGLTGDTVFGRKAGREAAKRC
ncbi:FAD/NAD(P)-binding domain-containing protein [Daedaleopsis nitida]|nr:FAD/NAD(P)-binding domain-containing protein [Daedaleopsis nitida]